ncbi:F12K21.23 [Arabidopsis thaliana]|uniref:F12K21.23 n=1 Tax=Arabidopsis thaliana TaxID=3702 RepID=Q9LNK5_ARATH|nr:F12K21.23 [Arabidopsis thaliana]
MADGKNVVKGLAARNRNITLILKLIFPASLYFIWRERNQRLHSATSRPTTSIIKEIKMIVRTRLDPLSRAQRSTPPALTLLATCCCFFCRLGFIGFTLCLDLPLAAGAASSCFGPRPCLFLFQVCVPLLGIYHICYVFLVKI